MQFLYEQTSLFNPDDVIQTAQTVTPYISHLQKVAEVEDYSEPESSINLPFDTALYEQVLSLVDEKVTSDLKYIFVIGIGGSNLGTKAVYDALYGYFDLLQPDRFPKMLFADTNDPTYVSLAQNFVRDHSDEPESFLFNVVTKSGGTTETLVNLEAIANVVPFEVLKERLVITTGENSKLWDQAKDNGIATISVPKQVGGRYSVLSAVGLFPLAACGIDISAIRDGAQVERGIALGSDVAKNTAALSAAILYLQNQKGYVLADSLYFHPELESLGKWYRQLMGESLGKEKDTDGTVVHAGITPLVSIGSVDLHSRTQLVLGGPRNTYTQFVSTNKERETDVVLPHNLSFPDLVNEIQNKSAGEIMWAISEAVKESYREEELPYVEIRLEEITPHEIGHYMQHKMLELMYLAKLMHVNAFDQPNVEAYKVETKRILGSHENSRS